MIERYLHSLDAELRVPRRQRARILAEAQDHLHEAVAAGADERSAVEAFGSAEELATRFHEQLASASARRASLGTAALVVIVALLMGLGPLVGFPYGVIVFAYGQLAVVAAVLALARSLRDRSIPPSRLADLNRANGVGVAAASVAAVVFALRTAAPIGGGVLLAACAFVAVSVVRSVMRARVVAAGAPSEEDAIDDIGAILATLPLAGATAEHLWRRVTEHLRTHPWRFCAAFALLCGVALAGWHDVVEGGPTITGRALLAGLILASAEALAVTTCFFAFGRYLGIRR